MNPSMEWHLESGGPGGGFQSNLPCSVRIQMTCFLPNREVNANHVRQILTFMSSSRSAPIVVH